MSPSKLNSLLTGTLVAIMIAVGGSVMAQDALRLWKPYSPESFGGGRRSNDGMYGSVSGIYWTISAPTGGYIGATTAKGKDETRMVWDGAREFGQTNSARINMMSSTTTLGTRFEVGNRRGHHGWLVSGYGLPGQSHSMSAQNMSVAIRDDADLTYRSTDANLGGYLFIWDRQNNSLLDPNPTILSSNPYAPGWAAWQEVSGTSEVISGLGYLWGYTDYITGDDVGFGIFAPFPVWFTDTDINIKSTHYSAELMYTYRVHPFSWGSMELLAGARYWEFKDSFGLRSGERDTNGQIIDMQGTGGQDSRVTALSGMLVDAEGKNHVFGPQVGIKLSRHNARWTFGAEGRLTAGINAQSVKTSGYIAPRDATYFDGTRGSHWAPIGSLNSNGNFGHKQRKTYFSPIGELRVSAEWQWTNAVSFFGAVDGMFAGNVARGYRVTDYATKSNGSIFGIRGNDRNTDVAVYGVETGIKVRR